MKGLSAIAKKTQGAKGAMIPLYYSIGQDKVSTEQKDGFYLVTYLINPNTPEQIKKAVERWLMM